MLVYQVLYWMDKKGMFNLFKTFWDYKLVLYILLSLYFSYWVFFLNILGVVEFASPFLAFIWPYFLYTVYSNNIIVFTMVILPIFLLPTTVNIDKYSEEEFIGNMSRAVNFEEFLHRNIFYIALDIFVVFGMSLRLFALIFGRLSMDPVSSVLGIVYSGFLWVITDFIYLSSFLTIFALIFTVLILLTYYKSFYIRYATVSPQLII